MKTLTKIISSIIALSVISSSSIANVEQVTSPAISDSSYQENWDSLATHEASPQWYQDAKLGIYLHWGVYSVPEFASEWYPRWMHFKGRKEYKHHLETYGELNEFGYHDFVPMFKGEHFDAKAWATLFKKAGAKFAGPVTEHHDGFAMWDSELTPWNAMDKGPKVDVTGELKEAITGEGMKFITTFHHSRNLQRYNKKENKPGERFGGSHYPYFEGTPPTSTDPELALLYGNIPEDEWNEKIWFGKLKEVIDNYQPDIVWFDSWLHLVPENYRKKFSAYYLNEAKKLNKEVVIIRKQNDLPLSFSVDDLEKSRKNHIGQQPWMTDETISKGSWSYTENLRVKEAQDVLHVLIDVVSKNGTMLLNVSPKANGIIPDNQQTVLLKMGAWLEKYGEAIYATRPWYTFGEGPTKEPEGHFKNHREFAKVKYNAQDIRYTTKGNSIYATFLGTPTGKQTLSAFAKSKLTKNIDIATISVLGSDETIAWTHTDSGLTITAPTQPSDTMATVLKIELAD
ncbi:alpha-L-fucosidase [Thalassotalea fonticola]|uniref:alpha-L-fucosidase n=1 Tax=Thalassotalea fonticola TaxID=3065649 RepID=A0ABZ0GUW4_9GAMM|nr:alpha-L-fucosidase [Colwelliaceae bacterium S1-1]